MISCNTLQDIYKENEYKNKITTINTPITYFLYTKTN